jgi:hypothetical protein
MGSVSKNPFLFLGEIMLYPIGGAIPGVSAITPKFNGKSKLSFTNSERQKGRETIARNRSSKNSMLAKSMKLCTCCQQEKSLLSFKEDSKTYTGYTSWCVDCLKGAKK